MSDSHSPATRKLAELLHEIASLADTADEVLKDSEGYHAAAAQRIVLQIGAVAEAGRVLIGDEPLLRGGMVDWIAPFMNSQTEASHA